MYGTGSVFVAVEGVPTRSSFRASNAMPSVHSLLTSAHIRHVAMDDLVKSLWFALSVIEFGELAVHPHEIPRRSFSTNPESVISPPPASRPVPPPSLALSPASGRFVLRAALFVVSNAQIIEPGQFGALGADWANNQPPLGCSLPPASLALPLAAGPPLGRHSAGIGGGRGSTMLDSRNGFIDTQAPRGAAPMPPMTF